MNGAAAVEATGQARIVELERRNRLLSEGLHQGDRIRQLLDQSVRELTITKAALDESRRFLERILTAAPGPIMVADARGRILLANAALEGLAGVPRGALIGRRAARLVPPGQRRSLLTKLSRLPSGNMEVIMPGPEGERTIHLEWSFLTGDRGGPVYLIAAGQDLTERKRAEEQIQRQAKDLKEMNTELTLLHQVSSALANTIDQDELYPRILKIMAEAIPSQRNVRRGIFALTGDRIRLVAHQGGPGPCVDSRLEMVLDDCLCGCAARSGEMLITNECGASQRHGIACPETRPHGHMVIPLKSQGRIVGVFYCYPEPDTRIDARKRQTFLTIGEQLGTAIDHARLYEEKKTLAMRDPLTGLANRRCMGIALEKCLARAKRYGTALSVIMLDIDHFKRYNDTYGHPAGDELLAAVSGVLMAAMRSVDLVVRYGGEEFLILLPDTGRVEAQEAAERIRLAVADQTTVTVSLGVATLHPAANALDGLVAAADAALYRAKGNGRNRVEVAAYRDGSGAQTSMP